MSEHVRSSGLEASRAGDRATAADLTRALRVVQLSEEALVIAGERRAPLEPWFRLWMPSVLGAAAALTGLLAGAGLASLLALATPLTLLVLRLGRRRPALVTISRGTRRALWRRGGVTVEFAWQAAEAAADRLAIALRLRTGEVRLPLSGTPTPREVEAALSYLSAFTEGNVPSTARALLVDDSFFEEFAFQEASPTSVVATAVDTSRVPPTVAILIALVSMMAAAGLAIAGAPVWLTASLLIVSPLLVFFIPVHRIEFQEGGALLLNGGWRRASRTATFDIELSAVTAEAQVPSWVDVVVGERFYRLVGTAWRAERLEACASFLRRFSAVPEDLARSLSTHPISLGSIVRVLSSTADEIVLAGPLRWRHRPLARSSILLFATCACCLPIYMTMLGPVGIAITAIAALLLMTRAAASSARPQLVFRRGSRSLLWRLRDVEVALRWLGAEPEATGRALVFETDAGVLRFPLRRRTPIGAIAGCIAALESMCRPAQPADDSLSPKGFLPAGFTRVLDNFHVRKADESAIGLEGGSLGIVAIFLLLFCELSLSFGVMAIEAPGWMQVALVLVFSGWPLLLPTASITLARGSRSAVVSRRTSQITEVLSAQTVRLHQLGSQASAESFGLSILVEDRRVDLAGAALQREPIEEARKAILEYAGLPEMPPHTREGQKR